MSASLNSYIAELASRAGFEVADKSAGQLRAELDLILPRDRDDRLRTLQLRLDRVHPKREPPEEP